MLYLIVRVLLYAAAVMPFLLWSSFLFPFITTKVLYFRLVVEAALFFYLILIWRYPAFRPRLGLLARAVWLYVAIAAIAAVFGVDFRASLLGTIERGEGLVTLLHFAVYFTMLPAILRTKKQWYNYLLFALSVTAAVAFYGLLQLIGATGVIQTGDSRISGTIGNAAFFAAYLMFGIFLALYLLREAPNWKHRACLWGILAFELIIFYQAQTRGAILAMAVAGLLWASWSLFSGRRVLGGVLIVLILGSGALLYAGRHSGFVRGNSTLARLASISGGDITTQSRLDTWRASWQAFKDRPALGWGYENYNIAFNKYFPARIYKDLGSQVWFDRAHNIFFDVAVTSGIFGILGYFGIFAAACWVLWRTRGLVLGLGLIAYFLQNLFVFDTQATNLMFFMVLGHIAFLEGVKRPRGAPWKLHWGIAIAAPGLALILIAYFLNLEPAAANAGATRGLKLVAAGLDREAKQSFERALARGTYMDKELRQQAAEAAGNMLGRSQLSTIEKGEMREFVMRHLRKNVAASPHDAKHYLYLMNSLNRLGDPADAGRADEVLALGQHALTLSPTRPQIYYELGDAYLLKGQLEAGLAAFRKAIELNPETKESHLNLLIAGIVTKRPEVTREQADEIISRGYKLQAADYKLVGDAYLRVGDKTAAVENYARAVELDTTNIPLRAKVAALYGDLCRLEEAKDQIGEVLRQDASYTAEANAFIAELEEKCKK